MSDKRSLWEAYCRLIDAMGLTVFGPKALEIVEQRQVRLEEEIEKAEQQIAELRQNWFDKALKIVQEQTGQGMAGIKPANTPINISTNGANNVC